MAPSVLQQRRTHNILLLQKLLNLRDGASPFTLICDTLEQCGTPVVAEFARRAKISKSKIIYISFTSMRKKIPFEPDVFISTRSKALSALRTEIISHLPPPATSTPPAGGTKYLLIVDTLNPLSTTHSNHLSSFLSSLLTSPQISLLASYHLDVPLPIGEHAHDSTKSYQAEPLTTLTYLATALLSISSLSQTIAKKRARDKSLQEPSFGLNEHREGVVFGLSKSSPDSTGLPDLVENKDAMQGVVIEMELRRRSGRGVLETFVLSPAPLNTTKTPNNISHIILLADHPLFTPPDLGDTITSTTEEETEASFSLHLTEKQKRDRENVVLPYFDAQKENGAHGPGEGGRILYEMGAEDREDFDDEEDEI